MNVFILSWLMLDSVRMISDFDELLYLEDEDEDDDEDEDADEDVGIIDSSCLSFCFSSIIRSVFFNVFMHK